MHACGICSERRLHRPVINYIHAGEECYEVHFANSGIAYYHVACMEGDRPKVQTIKSLDVDKWNGIDKFIESRMCNNQSDSQIMGEIATEFKCSHTTAWRRLREFKTKIP